MSSAVPADAMGLTDRGRIAPGLRADLSLVHLDNDLPVLDATFTDGVLRYASGALSMPALVTA